MCLIETGKMPVLLDSNHAFGDGPNTMLKRKRHAAISPIGGRSRDNCTIVVVRAVDSTFVRGANNDYYSPIDVAAHGTRSSSSTGC